MAFIRFSLRCKIHQPEISIELMARALEQKFFMAGLKYSRLISPTKINETISNCPNSIPMLNESKDVTR